MLILLEQALAENDSELRNERRLDRQVELMMARMEIYKSMVFILKQQEYITERKAA